VADRDSPVRVWLKPSLVEPFRCKVRSVTTSHFVSNHTANDAESAANPQCSGVNSSGLSDPERWVDEHGDYLFKYALLRLRDVAKAEDAVQETFLAGLKGGKSFAGRSAEKTWLVGILKNKISDYFRKASRETPFTDLEFYHDEESDRFTEQGPFKGGWIHELGPTEWSPDPGASLDNEAFWKTFHECAAKLPKNINAAFCLREIDDTDTAEICRVLNISENNLWVMLHRARMALRRCLETNWFSKSGKPG
jgi:RNA polymerase sigma-70 factor, ECF subfamily